MNMTPQLGSRALRSTSIIGGATVIALAFGLARSKAIALLLGPTGIGMFGILNTVLMSGAAVAGLSLGTSGVRALAATRPGSKARARVAGVLWTLTWLCTLVGGALFWIVVQFFYAPGAGLTPDAMDMAALTGGLALLIVCATQTAFIQAEGRVGDVARIRIGGGLIAAVLGIACVVLLGIDGLYGAMLMIGVGNALLSSLYYYRVPRPQRIRGLWDRGLRLRALSVLRIGGAITIGLLITGAGQLMLRAVVVARDGLTAAGYLQAALTISSANMAILLAALAVDYLPRLSAAKASAKETEAAVADQLTVTLALAAPLLIALVGFSLPAVRILFSTQFDPAADLLRWLVAADLLKIVAWCMGYVVLARGASSVFVGGELAYQVTAVGLTWILYPVIGLAAAGLSSIAGYAALFAIYFAYVRLIGVRLDRAAIGSALSSGLWLGVIGVAAWWDFRAGTVMATIIGAMLAWRALALLRANGLVSRLPAPLARLAGR